MGEEMAQAAKAYDPYATRVFEIFSVFMPMFIRIIAPMKFTWHESKRQINLKSHGFDFCDAEQVFIGATVTVEDKRDYGGEQRFNTTGLMGVSVVVITHTETENEIHIISMREAENHETRKFFSNL